MTTNTAQPRVPGAPRGPSLMVFVACALGASCLAIFFRETLISGGAMLPGELGDTRFNNALLENWVRWPGASWRWHSPPFFFPEPRVLAYSDALFLFTPFYALARAVGASPYYALACTTALLLVFGYTSAIWLFQRCLRLPTGLSYFGAALFAFAGFRIVHYGHVQLFATLFLPALFGAALRFLSDRSLGRPGLKPGLVLAAGVPLLLFTSYYVGWFFVFFLVLLAGFLALLKFARNGASHLRSLLSRRPSWSLAGLGAVSLVSLVPFLALYLPRYAELGPRSWETVAKALPRPIDLINVGPDNLVWGSLIARVVPPGRDLGWELEYGLPPGLFLLFCVTCAGLFLPGRWRMVDETNRRLDLLRGLGLSVLCAWVLLLYWHGHSLWFWVFKMIPGAGALRAVSRFQVVLHLAVLIVAMFGLSAIWRAARSSATAKALAIGLSTLLACEQVQRNPPMFDARTEALLIASVVAPPPFCAHFMLLPDPTHAREPLPFTANIDAMMIALRLRLPTINGYDGDIPAGWGLRDPYSPGYASAAADWSSRKGVVQGLCTLDLASGKWRQVLAADPAALVGKNLVALEPRTIDEALSFSRSGFYGLENDGRWTNGLGVLRFSGPVAAVRLHVDGAWNRTGAPVRVLVNGLLEVAEIVPNAPFSLDVALSESVQSIEIESGSFVPQQLGINDDPRTLGVLIERLVLY